MMTITPDPKRYRLGSVTMDQVEKIGAHLGGLSDTDVMRLCISEFYDSMLIDYPGSSDTLAEMLARGFKVLHREIPRSQSVTSASQYRLGVSTLEKLKAIMDHCILDREVDAIRLCVFKYYHRKFVK